MLFAITGDIFQPQTVSHKKHILCIQISSDIPVATFMLEFHTPELSIKIQSNNRYSTNLYVQTVWTRLRRIFLIILTLYMHTTHNLFSYL